MSLSRGDSVDPPAGNAELRESREDVSLLPAAGAWATRGTSLGLARCKLPWAVDTRASTVCADRSWALEGTLVVNCSLLTRSPREPQEREVGSVPRNGYLHPESIPPRRAGCGNEKHRLWRWTFVCYKAETVVSWTLRRLDFGRAHMGVGGDSP